MGVKTRSSSASNESSDSSGIFSGDDSFSTSSLNSSRSSLLTSPGGDELHNSFVGRSYEHLFNSCVKGQPRSQEDRLTLMAMVVVERKNDSPLCASYSHTTKNLDFFFKTDPKELTNIQLNNVALGVTSETAQNPDLESKSDDDEKHRNNIAYQWSRRIKSSGQNAIKAYKGQFKSTKYYYTNSFCTGFLTCLFILSLLLAFTWVLMESENSSITGRIGSKLSSWMDQLAIPCGN